MRRKGSGWHRESMGHKMSAYGIKTKANQIPSSPVNESSGMWFESNGVPTNMIQLAKVIDFDNVDMKVARGYERSSYEKDASQIAILPVSKAEKSVDWLEDEYHKSNQARKHNLMNIVKMTRARISQELGRTNPADTKVELHKSRNLYNDFIVTHGG